jgi:hypothetical protein
MSTSSKRLYNHEDTLAGNSAAGISTALPPVADPCQPTEERLALCAYFIWQSEGCPHGRDLEHWIQAGQQLLRSCQYDRSHGLV